MKALLVLCLSSFFVLADEIIYEVHEKPNGKSFCAKIQGEGMGKLIVERSVCDKNPSRLVPLNQFVIYPPEGKKKSEYCMELMDHSAIKEVDMEKCKKFQKDFPYLRHHINQPIK